MTIAEESPAGRPAAEARSIARLPGRLKVKPNSMLAGRAALEYVYVGADLRHIGVVAAALFGVLALLWVLVIVIGLDPFDLY